jgi:hypothetical protein
MKLSMQIVFLQLVKSTAFFVTLLYRQGWYNTPDNPDSPHGQYELFMKRLRNTVGTWWADWWWLGVRNTAFGLAYKMKPEHFKDLTSYDDCLVSRTFKLGGVIQKTVVDGYAEYILNFKRFHIIYGHRLTPIYNEHRKNAYLHPDNRIAFRPINMDARPILSIRSGAPD